MSSVKKASRTALGILTGYSAAKSLSRSQSRSFDVIASGLKSTVENVSEAFKSGQHPEIDVADMDQKRAFYALMSKAGYRREHMPALRQQTAVAAFVLALSSILFAASIAWLPAAGNAIVSLTQFAIPPVLMMMAVKKAYANWVYRNERHGSFSDFLKSGDWFPEK